MKNKNKICHAPYLSNSVAYDHDFWCTCIKWWYLQEFFFFLIFIFQAVRGVKGQKKRPKMKNNYIRHAPYLRNNAAYDHDFWYTIVKWWYLQVVFSFFQNFDFLGCEGGKRAENGPKWEKNSVCVAPYLKQHASYDFHLW